MDMDAPTIHPATESRRQATDGLANLRAKTTGLRLVIFISQKAGARHDARVEVSSGPRVQPDQMGSYPLRPVRHTHGPRLDPGDETHLRAWVDLNFDVLVGYWDGRIAFTEDAIELLKPI